MKAATKIKRKRTSARGARRRSATQRWDTLRVRGVEVLRAAPLKKLPWLVHGFTTRLGGESALGDERVLSLGFTEWDTRAAVHANRKKLLAALDAEEMRLVTLRQIHSDAIHHVVEAPPEPQRGLSRAPSARGDAHVTRTPGLLLAVQTADCVPILLADAKHRAVAAVHAGWRGTLKRIVAKTLGQMQMLFGTRPADVLAALGPGIGGCCYEVGPEVVQEFASQFENAREWFEATPTGPQGKTSTFDSLATGDAPNPLKWLSMAPPGHDPPPPRLRLNLLAANRWQLENAGVRPGNIVSSGLCTACRADLLFSHRREHGRTGRQIGIIGIQG